MYKSEKKLFLNNINGMSTFSPIDYWKQNSNNNSFTSVIENDIDKSESSLSHNSNRGFSIKDILPDNSFTSEPKHQRVGSSNLELLSPSILFLHMRKNSKPSFHEKKNSAFHESEELNSTRMVTSQSRRISEFELSCKENIQPKTRNGIFCGSCKKSVNSVDGNTKKKSIEEWFICGMDKIFSNFCWRPDWIHNLRGKICGDCGNKID